MRRQQRLQRGQWWWPSIVNCKSLRWWRWRRRRWSNYVIGDERLLWRSLWPGCTDQCCLRCWDTGRLFAQVLSHLLIGAGAATSVGAESDMGSEGSRQIQLNVGNREKWNTKCASTLKNRLNQPCQFETQKGNSEKERSFLSRYITMGRTKTRLFRIVT